MNNWIGCTSSVSNFQTCGGSSTLFGDFYVLVTVARLREKKKDKFRVVTIDDFLLSPKDTRAGVQ